MTGTVGTIAGGVGVGVTSEGAAVAGSVDGTVPLIAALCFDPMV